jgi:hypothetical protein
VILLIFGCLMSLLYSGLVYSFSLILTLSVIFHLLQVGNTYICVYHPHYEERPVFHVYVRRLTGRDYWDIFSYELSFYTLQEAEDYAKKIASGDIYGKEQRWRNIENFFVGCRYIFCPVRYLGVVNKFSC